MRRLILFLIISSFPLAAVAIEPAITEAVANPERPQIDVESDVQRKPAEVLSFFGLANGMKVLDVLAGGGYYTELASYIVGKEGEVTFYNNPVWANGLDSIPGKPLEQRFGDNRLPNVKPLVAEMNELELPDEYYDMTLFILGFHDIYFVDEDMGWGAVDEGFFLKALYDSLKPGGILGIVDHVATSGSPASTGDTLHRIDPALITDKLEATGFIFEAELDVLRNPVDDLAKSMNDVPRRTTDRVIYRFRKPQ